MTKVTDAIERHPAGMFLAFLALHAAVWSALPALFFLNLPLDLIEGLLFGREWQLGYDKLPPLPWWLLAATYRVFGPDLFFYVLSQAFVVATFAMVWLLARQLAGPVGALVAVLILDGLHYFTFTAPKFNHDVAQLPFWAMTGYAYWAALRQGRTAHWVLLGFAVGMSFWAKYFAVVQVAPLMLFGLFDRDARRTLLTPGPWIAVAVALLVMAPHLIWLVQNDFLPLGYAEARASNFKQALDYLTKPSRFVLAQLLFLLPSLVMAAAYLRRDTAVRNSTSIARPRPDAFDRRIISLLTFGPAATIVLLSIGTGRDTVDLWGYPLWLFLGVWIVLNARPLDRMTLWRIVFLWAACFIGTAGLFAINYGVLPRYKENYTAILYPGDQLAAEMSRRFRTLTGRPLAYLVGPMWEGGNVAHYAPEHPRVLIDASPLRTPWIDLGDLRTKGAVLIWPRDFYRPGLPPEYRDLIEDAEVQPALTLPMRLGPGDVQIGWALLRPRPVVADQQASQPAAPAKPAP